MHGSKRLPQLLTQHWEENLRRPGDARLSGPVAGSSRPGWKCAQPLSDRNEPPGPSARRRRPRGSTDPPVSFRVRCSESRRQWSTACMARAESARHRPGRRRRCQLWLTWLGASGPPDLPTPSRRAAAEEEVPIVLAWLGVSDSPDLNSPASEGGLENCRRRVVQLLEETACPHLALGSPPVSGLTYGRGASPSLCWRRPFFQKGDCLSLPLP